ncbi:hypothetical protein D0Z62_18000 [Providencia rettgeri]|nr:hypothetical protein D0Z62_18000 [Providencia rettgeri]
MSLGVLALLITTGILFVLFSTYFITYGFKVGLSKISEFLKLSALLIIGTLLLIVIELIADRWRFADFL